MNSLLQTTSSKVAVSFLVFLVILAACEMFYPAVSFAKVFENTVGVLLR